MAVVSYYWEKFDITKNVEGPSRNKDKHVAKTFLAATVSTDLLFRSMVWNIVLYRSTDG